MTLHEFRDNQERLERDISYIIEQLINEIKKHPQFTSWKLPRTYDSEHYYYVRKNSIREAGKIASNSLKTRIYHCSTRETMFFSTKPFSFWFRFKKSFLYM